MSLREKFGDASMSQKVSTHLLWNGSPILFFGMVALRRTRRVRCHQTGYRGCVGRTAVYNLRRSDNLLVQGPKTKRKKLTPIHLLDHCAPNAPQISFKYHSTGPRSPNFAHGIFVPTTSESTFRNPITHPRLYLCLSNRSQVGHRRTDLLRLSSTKIGHPCRFRSTNAHTSNSSVTPRQRAEELEQLDGRLCTFSKSAIRDMIDHQHLVLTIWAKSSSEALSAFLSSNANHSSNGTIGRSSSASAFRLMIARCTKAMISAQGVLLGLTMLSAGGGASLPNAVSKMTEATSSPRSHDTI